MVNLFINFLRDESGQDLVEYTLLLAFVALASAALFIGAGAQVSGIDPGPGPGFHPGAQLPATTRQ
jgi:Flp pilus assembly pilin Flp